jgi:hypothetical protein
MHASGLSATVISIVAFQESLESLIAVVSSFDEVVCDLDEIAHRDAHLGKPLNLEQSGEYFLSDIFGSVWGQGATAEAVDAVVVLLKEIKNNIGMG